MNNKMSVETNTQKNEKFCIIGISVRTTNENGQGSTDIPALWNEFMTQEIMTKIPQKVNNDVYCIYTDYEKDHTKPYTTIIGCKVENLEKIPDGMIGKSFETETYLKHTATGNILEGMVFEAWLQIWNSDWNSSVKRAYTIDFEVYGEKSQNPTQAEVEIFVSVK